MKHNIPYPLIAKHLAGESTPEEDQVLWDWIDEHDDHHTIFKEAIALLSDEDALDSQLKIRTLNNADHLDSRTPCSFSLFLKIAASLLIITTLLIGILKWSIDDDSTVLLSTNQGETGKWILPDSSVVWLNSDSKLTYNKDQFLNDRQLIVEGEIFLEIKPLPDQPFSVVYDSILMTTMAGSYNIRNYAFLEEKQVTIVKGYANFIDLRPSGSSILGDADENIISRNDYGLMSREYYADHNADAWRTHQYIFDELTAQKIFEMLAKDQGFKKVEIPDHALQYKRINGYYESILSSELMAKILEMINATIEVNGEQNLVITNKQS